MSFDREDVEKGRFAKSVVWNGLVWVEFRQRSVEANGERPFSSSRWRSGLLVTQRGRGEN